VALFCLRINQEVVFIKGLMLLLISNEKMITMKEVLIHDKKYIFVKVFSYYNFVKSSNYRLFYNCKTIGDVTYVK